MHLLMIYDAQTNEFDCLSSTPRSIVQLREARICNGARHWAEAQGLRPRMNDAVVAIANSFPSYPSMGGTRAYSVSCSLYRGGRMLVDEPSTRLDGIP